MRINEVPGAITVNNLSYFERKKADNSKYTEATAKEKNKSLYKESEYFFHTPSLKPVIETTEIAIDPPPPKDENDNKLGSIMAIGTSVTMSFISVLQGVQALNRIRSKQSTLQAEMLTLVTVLCMLVASVLFPVLA